MQISLRHRLMASTLFLGLACVAAPAFAQDDANASSSNCVDANSDGVCDDAAAQSTATANTGSAIVVTGTRITRPTLSSPVPLTTVTADELTESGDLSLGDALNDLPSLRTTYSQGNSTRFIGTAGLNLLDLRGLGVSRTLVLVNGKRHITASPGDYLVDVNTIPTDLLERVDIVTGGDSAVYGSDAVAGVVNFILKRDFSGLSVKGQSGISSRGDRRTYFGSVTWGTNFADGRGNIAIAGEYAKSDPLYFKERDYLTGAFSGRCQYNLVENPGGEPFGTDGITDNGQVCGIRNGSISDGGTIGGLGSGKYLRFDNNGNLYVDVPDQYLGSFTGNVVGGNGSTLRNTGQLAAGLTRRDVNLLAHYDFSDAFRPFIEAKYVKINAIQEGQPSFFTSVPGTLGGPSIKCDNAFLSAQALGVLQGYGICSNGRTNTQSLPLSRFNVDFGGRGEYHTRETYRVVAGVEGTFNDDWHYEVSANYGHLKTSMDSLNNLLLFTQDGQNYAGFNNAIDAVLVNGVPTCRINADADPSNNDPACVPINVFGYGQPSQAALNYVNTTAHRNEHASEFDLLASVSGDLSQLFELPGGPIGFALGGEYREERAYSAFDDLTASGATFLNAIQPFNPPALKVKEAFGEVQIPLLKDLPFARELTISAATRVSDYNTATGTVWAYNVQGIYAPIPDIRFRAAYATSVRAPTQSDLYSPLSQNFAQLADPCDSQNISNNPNRAANCAAAGVPAQVTAATFAACAQTAFQTPVGSPYINCLARTASTGFVSGGNPTLVAEKGKSLTLGVVFEPRFIPGLNFTVDYYNIKVNNLIASLGAQTILNQCYDNPNGITNPYCATVQRDPATGFFVEPAVISGGINYAAQKTEGFDFDLQYLHTFNNGQKLRFRAIATYLKTLDNYTDPTDPQLPDRQRSELGSPVWAASTNFNYDFGDFDFTWSTRFLDKQTISAYENAFPYIGRCPSSGVTGYTGNTCTPGNLVQLDAANVDQFDNPYFPVKFYNNFRLNWKVDNNRFDFYVGVDNAFDVKPPFGQLGTAGGDPYDTFGRYFYAGFTIDM